MMSRSGQRKNNTTSQQTKTHKPEIDMLFVVDRWDTMTSGINRSKSCWTRILRLQFSLSGSLGHRFYTCVCVRGSDQTHKQLLDVVVVLVLISIVRSFVGLLVCRICQS